MTEPVAPAATLRAPRYDGEGRHGVGAHGGPDGADPTASVRRAAELKLSHVEVYLVHAPIPPSQQVESGAGRKLARQMCLIEVVAEDGTRGYGSPSGPYDLGVLERIVNQVIAPHVVGANPFDAEYLWHRLYHGEVSRNLGHRGVGIAALSGIDIALWDLKAKAVGLPLYQLLGGTYHVRGVRTYASSIYWGLPPSRAAEEAAEHVAAGFRAVKLKVGRDFRSDARNIGAIRDAVGDEVEILVDANQSLSRVDALRLLEVLEGHGCYWFEEPISIDDIAGHTMLRAARRSVRIATGENLYTRYAFAELARHDAIDVLQADVSRAGGITEVHRIAQMASCVGVDWNPHTFNDMITVLANLHLVVASPHPAMFEYDVTHNDLMARLTGSALELRDGRLHCPPGPGLGVDYDWDFIKAHRWDGSPSIGVGHGMTLSP